MPFTWQNAGRCVFAALLALGLAGFGWLGPADASAALKRHDLEYRNDPTKLRFEPVCTAILDGRIEEGDYETVKAVFDKIMADSRVAPVIARVEQQLAAVQSAAQTDSLRVVDRSFYALCLNSPGGNLKEAIKIASLFKGWMMVVGLDAVTDEPHQCYSACAVIFMSAKRRDGIYESNGHKRYPGRFLHCKAKLGFHAPELVYPDTYAPTVTTKQAAEAYSAAVSSIREIVSDRPSPHVWDRATLGRYRGTDFPAGLLVEMLTTPLTDMSVIESVSEAVDWGIELFGFEPPAVLTDRLAMTVCSNLAWKRCEHSESQDRCDDSFVTAAQWPANWIAGVKPLRKVSALAELQPQTPEYALKGDRTAIEAMLGTWKIKSSKLWPKAGNGRVTIWSAMLDWKPDVVSARHPCALVATFDGDRVVNVEAQTFNGSLRYWLKERPDGPALGIFDDYHKRTEDDIVSERYRADTPEHVGLTRMLPGKAQLSDLNAAPWAWHNSGKPIFGVQPLR